MVLSLLYLISLWSTARCPQKAKELSLPGCFLVHFDFKVRCGIWCMLNSNIDHNRHGPASPASLLSTVYFPVSLRGVDEQRSTEDHSEQKEGCLPCQYPSIRRPCIIWQEERQSLWDLVSSSVKWGWRWARIKGEVSEAGSHKYRVGCYVI